VKIAIFGGSFDPPHIGHEAIAKEALKQLNIDKLIVIPNFLNPFKKFTLLNAKNRLYLLQKLFKQEPKIDVCDFEVLQNKAVYSIQTVKDLKKRYNTSQIFLIIGADNLENLHLWHNYEELKNLVTFVTVTRSGYLNKNYDKIQTLNVEVKISSTKLRDNLDLNYIPNTIKNDVKILWQKYKGKNTLENRIEIITQILDEKKAENIDVINLKDKDYIVDAVIIATTLNSKHGFSLLTYLKEGLKPLDEEFVRVEENDDWTIVDLGDVLIHLMSESHRKKYNIEEFLSELGKNK
jgi:nicotinate-nucleotide adenylyltransferase